MELYHHGVKGQKWGVRRYQNYDGSRISGGSAKGDSKAIDINNMDRKQLINMLKNGYDFVVKKGSTAYRTTTNSNETLAGKKYVSLKSDDVATYEDMVVNLNLGSEVYDDAYSTTKNMNVAGVRVQAEILQQMYGKQLTDSGRARMDEGIKSSILNKPIGKMSDSEFRDYMYANPYDHDFDILAKSSNDSSSYMERLKKKGYDAVVDMLDSTMGYSDAPMIVLKAEDTLKKQSSKRVY